MVLNQDPAAVAKLIAQIRREVLPELGAGRALTLTVNVTARLASAAATGEILVSEDTASRAGLADASETRTLNLRGRNEPLDVRVLLVEPATAGTTPR